MPSLDNIPRNLIQMLCLLTFAPFLGMYLSSLETRLGPGKWTGNNGFRGFRVITQALMFCLDSLAAGFELGV